jgi:DNA repair protein RecO (recombination protein O)
MGYFKTEGIVLKNRVIQESDKIVTLYTRDFGKINCIAKGAKKIKSRISAKTEIFTNSYFLIAEGKNLFIITDAEIISSNIVLRENLKLFLIASSITELVDKTQADGEKNKKIFNLLKSTLKYLRITPSPLLLFRIFQANLIKFSGYHPQLYKCVKCGRDSEEFKFSPQLGGIICEKCSCSGHFLELDRKELLFLRFIFSKNNLFLSSFEIEEALDKKIQNVLKYFLEERYGNIFKCDIYSLKNFNLGIELI